LPTAFFGALTTFLPELVNARDKAAICGAAAERTDGKAWKAEAEAASIATKVKSCMVGKRAQFSN
jgi:hypothetical protein